MGRSTRLQPCSSTLVFALINHGRCCKPRRCFRPGPLGTARTLARWNQENWLIWCLFPELQQSADTTKVQQVMVDGRLYSMPELMAPFAAK